MITIFQNGERIGQSKNLRGVNDRCRKVPGASATVLPDSDWGYVRVEVNWPDGAFASIRFASRLLAEKYAATKRFQGV